MKLNKDSKAGLKENYELRMTNVEWNSKFVTRNSKLKTQNLKLQYNG
jgi:hypothetical protein